MNSHFPKSLIVMLISSWYRTLVLLLNDFLRIGTNLSDSIMPAKIDVNN